MLLFIFIIGCAGTSEQSGTEQLSDQDLSFNSNEPWTGNWKVKGSTGYLRTGDYVLILKQDDNIVKSLSGSSYDFKGKVVGNQLEGRFVDNEYYILHRLTLKMSEDLKSFEGTDRDPTAKTHPVKGVRQD